MKQSKTPLWKKSIVQFLNLYEIRDFLWEIEENGNPFGYETEESGYYLDYKELFDDLSAGAYTLLQALDEYLIEDNWDDMTVALLGKTHNVLGFDAVEMDYYGMLSHEEDLAVSEAEKRIKRLTKDEMIRTFRRVLVVLVSLFDIKSAHDCLTSIVQELDEKGAILERKNNEINRLYQDLTGRSDEQFDALLKGIPQRMWVE